MTCTSSWHRLFRGVPSLLVLLMLLSSLTGCIVHTREPRRHHRTQHVERCHPSQYWDGHQCRHKGRGHGARKHDGRR